MKISGIICTYNRAHSLSEMLESLLKLKTDGTFDYEILLVDNNSKDETRQVIESFMARNNRIKYFFEPNQGISNARNAGINHSDGEIIAFTDDDVLIDENWLINTARFVREHDFDAAGGRVLPLYPTNTPPWIKDCCDILAGPIVCHDYGDAVRQHDSSMLPFVGANVVIKRQILAEIGAFNPDIGLGKGTMGEDTEFFRRIERAGKKIYYAPDILILHPVDSNRMSLSYIAKWHASYGRYLVIKKKAEEHKDLAFVFGVPRYLWAQVVKFSFRILVSLTNKRSFIDLWCALFIRIGMIEEYRSQVKTSMQAKLAEAK